MNTQMNTREGRRFASCDQIMRLDGVSLLGMVVAAGTDGGADEIRCC
jgi:hypothetical protein